MQNVYAERLHKLSQYLRNLSPDMLYMDHFVEQTEEIENLKVYPEGSLYLPKDELVCVEKPMCGTTACALGWATTIPEFRAEGWALVNGDPCLVDWKKNIILTDDSFKIADDFFGLEREETLDLFGGSDFYQEKYNEDEEDWEFQVTPTMVADEIDLMIKKKWPDWSPSVDYLAATKEISNLR